MPRKKWIDKNAPTSQTFQLLYRSQDDPLLHDENEDERALFPVGGKAKGSSSTQRPTTTGLHIADLEDNIDLDRMRENEGEAAEYGIYFDDTEYDYMQHLRDLGNGGGESYFVDAAAVRVKGKGKAKTTKLEDALREISLDDEESAPMPGVPEDGLSTFSKSTKQRTYQDQQDIPDEIAGFQPDMDPRLREVLEALEDDAYVDENDEDDVFGELGKAGHEEGEIDLAEFELRFDEGEDEGWESDVTEKAAVQPKQTILPSAKVTDAEGEIGQVSSLETSDISVAAAVTEDGDWLRDFAKYKRDVAATKKAAPPPTGSVVSGFEDRAQTLYTLNGTPLRQKKRKGALTNPSAYSMTSSSLARTDGQQLLDQRFDQIEKMYALDEEDEFGEIDGGLSVVSGMTGRSKMSHVSTASFADKDAVRSDFDGMMDDFLGDWNKANPGGKRKGAKGKRGKNGNEIYGLQQLDEVRRELGPARIYRKVQKT